MRVSDAGEFGLIDILRRMLESEGEALVRGIGDDAAVFNSRGEGLWAFTVDAMVQGIHFDLAYVPWHALGYKALAINLSDLAAMGGAGPSFALVVLGLQDHNEVQAVKEMYRGLMDCGARYSCQVVGGDIVKSPRQMFISVSLAGSLPGDRFLCRDRARPGQAVMVTGQVGDSYLGLQWLMAGRGDGNECAQRHLYPRPRLEQGRLALDLGVEVAIDISDGLLRDLGHICEESGVGADIVLERLPLSTAALETAQELGLEAAGAALHGGEDYELIMVTERGNAAAVQAELGATVIGETTTGPGVRVLDSSGRPVEMERYGYEHFKEE